MTLSKKITKKNYGKYYTIFLNQEKKFTIHNLTIFNNKKKKNINIINKE